MAATEGYCVEKAWEDHENLVRFITWQSIRRYGGDFEEDYSEALVFFMQAFNSYEPMLGTLSSWIGFKVSHGLMELKRNRARHYRITGPIVSIESQPVANRPAFMDELWKNLSVESQEVLTVLFNLDAPAYKNKSLFKCLLRMTLRQLDYSNDKITECFREIEAALVV